MLTQRSALELVGHEAIVREMYLDSVRVPTWGIGVTTASGHAVERYKDNPQSIEKCIAVFLWLIENKYMPDVLVAFKGHVLKEHELAAAVSFHYNTGAIKRATWVKSFLAGRKIDARAQFMNWNKPPEIKARRAAERDLFFDAKWAGDGKATLYAVSKPSYHPNWRSAKRIDIRADLEKAMAS